MLKFGFIGIGQVGGEFVSIAKEYDYEILAINTAKIDLDGLKTLEKSEKIHLSGYEGAGKDRSIGEEAFEEHQESIIEAIDEKMKHCHVLFPVFSLGGGTGSGVSASLIEKLGKEYEEKVISPICFMPYKTESPRAKMNALECFSEMSCIEEIGSCLIVDNEKVVEKYKNLPLKEKYIEAKKEIVRNLHTINHRTSEQSEITNIDKMDLLTVLSERGSMLLSSFVYTETETTDSKKLGEKMLRSWKQSIYATTNYKEMAKVACVLDLPEMMTKTINIEESIQTIGKPLEIFAGMYTSDEKKGYSLVTGLPFPTLLLKELEEEIKKEEKQIIETLDKARTQTFEVKSSWTQSLKRKRKAKV